MLFVEYTSIIITLILFLTFNFKLTLILAIHGIEIWKHKLSVYQPVYLSITLASGHLCLFES